MRKLLILAIAALVLMVSCSKAEGGGTSIPPNVTATATVTNTPGAATSPNISPGGTGNTNGEAGKATNKPSSGATTAPENLPGITKEQVAKMDLNSTYEDLVKFVGKDLKPVKEESGKKTYELKISNEVNKFVEVTYFSDGKMSEMKVYQR